MKVLLKDKFAWILFAGSIMLCWLFVGQYGLFGSNVDWINQHSVLPDYFRQRFYQTGSLLPDIAWDLGGGQNIYNFCYYGLLNPVILCSYLLPFIRMDDYIMGSSILCYSVSVVLFYRWLGDRGFSANIRKGVSCMFALAAPLIYHSYNQLMFVNYMPFLCLGLLGTDRYIKLKKRGVLIFGVCGMVFTSFYFSIGGMMALGIYGFGEYLRGEKKTVPVGKLAANILLGVSLSGILLVPAAMSIFAGRTEDVQTETALKLIAFKPERFFYSAYGIGLTAFVLVCLIGRAVCCNRWRDRWNSVILLIIFNMPVFGYVLNGGLYEKDKVFIPFLPLVCLETAKYCSECMGMRKREGKDKTVNIIQFLPYISTILLVYLERNYGTYSKYWPLILTDSVLMLLLFLVYKKYPRLCWPLMASCVILFCYGWTMNRQQEKMISEEEYAKIRDTDLEDAVERILRKDASFYRMDVVGNGTENKNNMNRVLDIRQRITSLYSSAYNADYQKFRKDIFKLNEPFRNHLMQSATDNPCFLQFMGVKYLAAKRAPSGYNCLEKGENFNIYKNESAAPVMYVTNQVMKESEYLSLPFPENQTVLLQRAVVPDGKESTDVRRMTSCDFLIPPVRTGEITIERTEDGYRAEVKKETQIDAVFSGTGEDDLLAVIFDVENERPNKDMYIRLQGQTNRLSAENHEYANRNTEFTYMVTPEGKDLTERREKTEERKVQMKFGPGKYRITNVRAFTGNMEKLCDPGLYGQTVEIDQGEVKGDQITGKVSAKEEGYLVTSIPFDENFTVKIDGKQTEVLKVNTSFLGAKVPEGDHAVVISYRAPGKRAGITVSMLGVLILLASGISSRLKNCKREKRIEKN